MFRAAQSGPAKAITANRLDNGLVVFLDSNGGWTLDIGEARVLGDDELEEALAYGQAQHDARVVIEPYAIDVEVTDGVPMPIRLRERIRAERGPTIAYGDAERAELAARGD
ncbi:DUF2849 domain-containing protein [Bauldia sp.]|uniref:DUF2849 domain-containing protein n=1 Tax=Bauldia sp. TaxID=2575872 RepID=UPI003BAA30A7